MGHDPFNRPFTRPGDMVRNKLCWNGTSKTKELVPVQPDVPLLTQWEKDKFETKDKKNAASTLDSLIFSIVFEIPVLGKLLYYRKLILEMINQCHLFSQLKR